MRELAEQPREAVSGHMASIEKSKVVKIIRANSKKLVRAGGPVDISSNLDRAFVVHTREWPRIKISLDGDTFDGTWLGDKKVWQVHQSTGVAKAPKKTIKDAEAVKLFQAIFDKAELP